MEMKRCEKGHFYDAKIWPACPYCNGNFGQVDLNKSSSSDNQNISKTMPINNNDNNIPKTMPINNGNNSSSIPKTRPQSKVYSNNPNQNENVRTVNYIQDQMGIDPVVAWLVCIEGINKGRDYRIHGQRNFIGRGENMDICIRGDNTVSRENHAILSYDVNKNRFSLYQGMSRGIAYVNNEEVITAVVLKQYDVIQLGSTKLMFIAFCGEKFKWE